MLPPNELDKKDFTRVVRGYSSAEVDEHIAFIIEKYTELYRENNELERMIKTTQAKLDALKKDEESIRAALINAQKASSAIINEANDRAEVVLRATKTNCEKILSDFRADIRKERDTIEALRTISEEFKANLFLTYNKHIELIGKISTEISGLSDLDITEDAFSRRVIENIKRDIIENINSTETQPPPQPKPREDEKNNPQSSVPVVQEIKKSPKNKIVPPVQTIQKSPEPELPDEAAFEASDDELDNTPVKDTKNDSFDDDSFDIDDADAIDDNEDGMEEAAIDDEYAEADEYFETDEDTGDIESIEINSEDDEEDDGGGYIGTLPALDDNDDDDFDFDGDDDFDEEYLKAFPEEAGEIKKNKEIVREPELPRTPVVPLAQPAKTPQANVTQIKSEPKKGVKSSIIELNKTLSARDGENLDLSDNSPAERRYTDFESETNVLPNKYSGNAQSSNAVKNSEPISDDVDFDEEEYRRFIDDIEGTSKKEKKERKFGFKKNKNKPNPVTNKKDKNEDEDLDFIYSDDETDD